MKGRKPKPLERQIIEGDPRKHGKKKLERQLDKGPKAATGLPPCPKHLKGRARSAWNFWSAELAAMKLDKRPDGPMLEGACINYARAIKMELILEEEGYFIDEITSTLSKRDGVESQSMTKRRKPHAAVGISNKAWTLVKAFCSEFGLSPVSRTRLSIEPAAQTDDLAALLAAPRPERPPLPVN